MKSIAAYIDANGMKSDDFLALACELQNKGTDEIVVTDFTEDEKQKEAFLDLARELSRTIDIPFVIGTYVHRFEDTKKAFYTGAKAVILKSTDIEGTSILKESTDRFGKGNIYVLSQNRAVNEEGEELVLLEANDADGFAAVLTEEKVKLVAAKLDDCDIMTLKREVAEKGADVNTFTSAIDFDELKTDASGLIPCIVQDYKTNEVLMMAYMDKEAFERTAATGIMTYHSRSRKELWIKGETSGHYQYVRELSCDCDKDTLLAKVVQIGAACHTNNYSCFFNEMIKHEYETKDISKVLSSLYDVVIDRKKNPKEGSYTNYLFDKGIDKILKKCGEEATEMVIAAKNPNAEELKYEIADLLYHMTVLMVECGVDWQDVAGELANR